MNWIGKHNQTLGWVIFTLAFLIVVLAPNKAWWSIPLYVAAAALFVHRVMERRQRGNGS